MWHATLCSDVLLYTDHMFVYRLISVIPNICVSFVSVDLFERSCRVYCTDVFYLHSVPCFVSAHVLICHGNHVYVLMKEAHCYKNPVRKVSCLKISWHEYFMHEYFMHEDFMHENLMHEDFMHEDFMYEHFFVVHETMSIPCMKMKVSPWHDFYATEMFMGSCAIHNFMHGIFTHEIFGAKCSFSCMEILF